MQDSTAPTPTEPTPAPTPAEPAPTPTEPTPTPTPTPAKGKKPSAKERLAAKRADAEARRAAAAAAAGDPAPGEAATTAARKAETQAEKWTKERARIAQDRVHWSNLLNVTLVPVAVLGARAAGLDMTGYQVEIPVLKPDGSGGHYGGSMAEGLAVVLGQNIACVASAEVAMERPWAIPLVSTLVYGAQVATVLLLAKAGVSAKQVNDLHAQAKAMKERLNADAPPPNGAGIHHE